MKKIFWVILILFSMMYISEQSSVSYSKNSVTAGYFKSFILKQGISGHFIKLDDNQALIMSIFGDWNTSYIYNNNNRTFTPVDDKKYIFKEGAYWSFGNCDDIFSVVKPNTQVGVRLNDGKVLLITKAPQKSAFNYLLQELLKKWAKEPVLINMRNNPCRENEELLLNFVKDKDQNLYARYISLKKYLEDAQHAHIFDPKTKAIEKIGIPPLKYEKHLYKLLLPNGNVLLISESKKKSAIYDCKTKTFKMLPDNHKINGYENYILLNNGRIFMTKNKNTPYQYDIYTDELLESKNYILGEPSEIPVHLSDDKVMFITYDNGHYSPIQCYNPVTNEVKIEGYMKALDRKGNDMPVLLKNGNVIVAGEHRYSGWSVYEYVQEIFDTETFKTRYLKNIVHGGYQNIWKDAIVLDNGDVLIKIDDFAIQLYIPQENCKSKRYHKREYKLNKGYF